MQNNRFTTPPAKRAGKLQNNILLNTWGVFFYFFCQWALTIVVTRIKGYETAGQYSLAVSFANIFSFIGMFGVRGLQVSDVERKYTDGQYYALRLLTCGAAVVLFAIVLPMRNYSQPIVWSCIAMFAFKLVECLYDVTIGTMQRNDAFFCVAVSYTIRGVLPALAFMGMLWGGATLPAAIAVMAITMLASFAFYDVRKLRNPETSTDKLCLSGTRQILKESFPLMLTALLDATIIYLPRDAVEKVLGSEMLGYYSTISIVVVVLSTLGSAVWGSIMPRLSKLFAAGDYPSVRKMVYIIEACIAAGAVAVLILGNLLGPFLFRIIFGPKIMEYMYLLTPVLLNAILLLLNSFYQCIFIPIKKRTVLPYTNVIAVATCAVCCNLLVRTNGITGACIGLTISLSLRAVLLTTLSVLYTKRG